MALRFMRGHGSLERSPWRPAGAALIAGLSFGFTVLLGSPGCVAPAMVMGDINTAQAELSAAQTADAPKLAPYEYTLAELYLERARDRMGTSDFQESYEYARKAALFAKQAIAKAEIHTETPAVAQVATALDAGHALSRDAGAAVPAEAHP